MFTSSNIDYEANKQICKSFIETNVWVSFDEYSSFIESIRFVILNQSQWELSICSCAYWNNNLICKHTIAVVNHLNLNQFPALNLNIEAHTKRGRRKQAAQALEPRISTGPVNPLMVTIENMPNVTQSTSIVLEQPNLVTYLVVASTSSGSMISIEKIHNF